MRKIYKEKVLKLDDNCARDKNKLYSIKNK